MANRARIATLPGVAVLLSVALATQTPLAAQDIDVSGVVHGEASVTSSGDLTTIQATDGAVIEYHRFGVGESATVRFEQPDSTSRVLNRVVGADPSHILGRLEANGIVYLVNPAGVVFGPNAIVDVSAIAAVGGQLSNEDFLANRDQFRTGSGSVTNHGVIRADQFVHLMGESVANLGSIVASEGIVSLSSGRDVFIREGADGLLVRVESTTPVAGATGAAVVNSGTIDAADVFFAAGDLYSLAIANDGTVTASRRLDMVGRGEVSVAGQVTATDGTRGGDVSVRGSAIVLEGARIDVSGSSGGGRIELGGGPRSSIRYGADESTLPSTVRLFADEQTVLRAEAHSFGDGGRVIVWSDAATYFAGGVRATGGASGGDGGFVEISGAAWLSFSGTVDATASHGETGTLLLDPLQIEVVTGGALTPTDVDSFLDAGSDPAVSQIDPATLDAVGATVTLEATDSITITDAVALTTVGAGFEARAGGNIVVNAAISTRGGDVRLTANDSTSGSATGSGGLQINSSIVTNGAGATSGQIVAVVDGGTGTIELGADLTSGSHVTFQGPLVLIGGGDGSTRTIHGGASVTFAGTVDGARRLVVLAPSGATTFSGMVGSTTPLTGLLTDVGGGTTLASDVTVGVGGLELRDSASLTGDLVLRTLGGGTLRLGGTVDSVGGTHGLTLLTLNSAGTDISDSGVIRLGGAIGSSGPLASLRLNTSPGVGARVNVPTLATIVGESDLTIHTVGELAVGAGEKWTTLGSLHLISGTTVTLGDLSALGNITIDASNIVIQRRSAALVRDAAGRLFLDGGVDLVSGGVFALSVAPTVSGAGSAPLFATPTGAGDTVGTLAGQPLVGFGQIGLAQMIGSSGSVAGRVLDLAVFSVASEAGVPAILAAAVEPGWPAPLVDPNAPFATMAAAIPRVRRHGLSSWIEWSEE